MVLTGSCVLAPARPAFVSPSPAESPPTGLAPATGAPGPHAFAVRIRAARHAAYLRPSHSIPRSWRSRSAPLLGWNGRMIDVIFDFCQAEIMKFGILHRTVTLHQIEMSHQFLMFGALGIFAQSRASFAIIKRPSHRHANVSQEPTAWHREADRVSHGARPRRAAIVRQGWHARA